MILALKIVAVILVVLSACAVALRYRKLRLDEMRELSKPLDRRLVAPPPSPYAPSKGFRLLDDAGVPVPRAPVERPRLDPDRHYVFSDSVTNTDELSSLRSRHNDDWFLSRSSHRSTLSILARRVGVLVLVALIIVVLATYYVNHHPPKVPSSSSSNTTTTKVTSTTTTTTTATTTGAVFPSTFSAVSTSGDDATYDVPASRYDVTVTGTNGPTWAVYEMGPHDTLEWQNTIALGHDEALTMIGNSRITIGSPSSASVKVDGRPVNFPSPLPATLNLDFVAASTG